MCRKLHYLRRLIIHLQLERWASPISVLLLVTDRDGVLRALEFADRGTNAQAAASALRQPCRRSQPGFTTRPDAYFEGSLDVFSHMNVATGVRRST
jgi:hypothetical protein